MSEPAQELKSCPFCDGKATITEHYQGGAWRLLHFCPVVGAISLGFTAPRSRLVTAWNTRVGKDDANG